MEVCGGQPRAPRPDASPHPRRGRRRGRIFFVLSRGRRRSQVLGRRVLTKNGNVPNTRVRARWSVFPGRARRTGVLDDPRGPRREAREIYARSDTDDRGGHRGEPPRCLPAHRQTHLDAPRAGGTGEDVGGLPMDYRKSVFRQRRVTRPATCPGVVLATSAQRQHQVKHRTALYVVVFCGPVVVHLLPAEDQSGGGEGEGDVSRGRRRFEDSRKLFVEDLARRGGRVTGNLETYRC